MKLLKQARARLVGGRVGQAQFDCAAASLANRAKTMYHRRQQARRLPGTRALLSGRGGQEHVSDGIGPCLLPSSSTFPFVLSWISHLLEQVWGLLGIIIMMVNSF